jgi:hypothetical protein
VDERERARTSKRGTEKKGGEGERRRHNNDSNGGFVTTTTAMGASWAWTGAPARHRRPGEDRRRGCTCSTVIRRGTAQGSSYHRRHCSPKHQTGGWRRAVGCGSSRQDFPPLAQAYGCVSRRWRHFFFRVLEPSAPTTLTSWGRHPVRTPTTVASHESRTPVSAINRAPV